MRALILIGLSAGGAVHDSGAFASNLRPTSCFASILESFPEFETGCRPYEMYEYLDEGRGHSVTQVSCHFQNQISLYAYETLEGIKLDIKGVSGRAMSADLTQNRTESFETCSQLNDRIAEISRLQGIVRGEPGRREFHSHEDILLVASMNNCTKLGPLLNRLLEKWESEGRTSSELICLPQSIVQTTNPALIKRELSGHLNSVEGIVLIGDDIPPYEYFFRTGWSGDWAAYKYGVTDLPYGNLEGDFWDRPISKYGSDLKEIVYREKDFVYPLDKPTKFSYDLDTFASQEKARPRYRQGLWVARWLSQKMSSEQFSRFVKRRQTYSPPEFQNLSLAQGAQSFMLRYGEHREWDRQFLSFEKLRDVLPSGSSAEIFMQADLMKFLQHVPRSTTELVLNEHGNSSALGNINIDITRNVSWFPELMHLESCLVGAWGYAGGLSFSLLAGFFSVDEPPVAITAAQGVMSMATIGGTSQKNHEVYLDGWRVGQSLGHRQIETVNNNMDMWRERPNPYITLSPTFFVADLFLTTSIFGDGSVER